MYKEQFAQLARLLERGNEIIPGNIKGTYLAFITNPEGWANWHACAIGKVRVAIHVDENTWTPNDEGNQFGFAVTGSTMSCIAERYPVMNQLWAGFTTSEREAIEKVRNELFVGWPEMPSMFGLVISHLFDSGATVERLVQMLKEMSE